MRASIAALTASLAQTLVVAALLVVVLPFGAELGVPGNQVQAAEEEEKKQKTRRVPTMSEQTFKKLAEAQEFIDLKDFTGALKVLDGMLERSRRMNGNEIGQVHNMRGFVYFTMEDYEGAIREYKTVVAQGDEIPEGLETTTLYTLAQLSFVIEAYRDALDYMETWLTKATNPGADPHIFMGQVYYQMKDYPSAIDQIETGIRIAKERELTVKENWWALLNYLYFEQENWPRVLEILEILVQDFPKRDYWIRLAGVHGQQGNEKAQVHAMQGAYTAGFLERERDLLSFAGLLMQEQVPYRAAVVLEKAFEEELIEREAKNLQALGQAWQLAQETDKAIPVYEEAGRLSDDGRIYERLAQLYLDDDQFDSCVSASERALDKGGLRSVQQAHIVKGMCQFNKNQSNIPNLNVARRAFVECRREAREEEDTSNQRVCQQWITYIDRETQRLEQLQSSI
jgi:tetratricopeptide (TPR) repeat protein